MTIAMTPYYLLDVIPVPDTHLPRPSKKGKPHHGQTVAPK